MRYRALGNTPDTLKDLKDYFDISVYRNILDMITTYQDAILSVGRWAREKLNILEPGSRKVCGGRTNPRAAFEGSLHTIIVEGWNYNAQLRALGIPAAKYNNTLLPQISPYDLISLARSLEWEMNRVRLPLPHNFRQLSALVGGRVYTDITTRCARSGGKGGGYTHRQKVRGDQTFPAIKELLNGLKQLQNEIPQMRNTVRKEIDAANLAKKVQEETIRREQEELIKREQAEREARERAIAIKKQKENQYLKDYETISVIQSKLLEERAKALTEYNAIEAQIAASTDANEINSLKAKLQSLVPVIDSIEQREKALDTQALTLINAVKNLGTENQLLMSNIANLDIERNKIKLDSVRELEKLLERSRQKAIEKLEALENERRLLEAKKKALADQAAAGDKSAEGQAKIVDKQIENNQNQQDQIIDLAITDKKATDISKDLVDQIETDNKITEEIKAIRDEIAKLIADSKVTPTDDAAKRLEELKTRLETLDLQKQIINRNVDILKKESQTLEETAIAAGQPQAPGVGLALTIGVLALLGN